MYVNQICTQEIRITTTGEAGAATGTEYSIPIQGFLLDVMVAYDGGAPATTDVSIQDQVFGDILVISNSNSDAKYSPRMQICDAAAAALPLYDLVPVNGALRCLVGGSDAITDCVVITLRWVTP
jgi:hypothetical protein